MSISQPIEKKEPFNQALKNTVLIYQAIAVIAFIFIPIAAIQWSNLPFMGAFVEHTMVFNGIGPTRESTENEAWQLFDAGLTLGDQLTKINGENITSAKEISEALSTYSPNDEIQITYLNAEGKELGKTVKLIAFPTSDKIKYFVIPYGVGLVYLILGLWMSRLRLSESAGRAFILFATSFSLGSAALFDLYTTHTLTILWTFSVAIAGGALLDLSLTFPQEFNFTKKYPFFRRIGYGIALVLGLLALPSIYNLQVPIDYVQKWQYIYGFTGFSVIFFIGALFVHGYTDKSPVAKQQIKMVWWGILLSFAPLGIWLFISFFRSMNFSPYLFIPTIGFPLITGYAILRYRLFRVDYLFSRGILVISLSAMASIGYGLILWGAGLISGTQIPANNPWAIGAFIAFLAFIMLPIRERVQTTIDAVVFRGKHAFQEQQQKFGQKMTNAKDLLEITTALQDAINESMLPNILHTYILDPASNQYNAMVYKGKSTSDIRFTSHNPLVKTLLNEKRSLYLDPVNPPESLEGENTRLALLNASLFVPLKSINKLMGWVAMGLRRSGDPYSSHELDFLENLSNQAGIAIERAQVVVNMEKQVEEMNALTRISQGVSITLSFNDVLELIFAQTTQIIPATDFHITLNNPTGDYFYYAFCIEDKQRLDEKENLPLPYNQGIAQWVARNSRAILSQDYSQECQRLNVVPSLQKIYAWIGVPLNAGSETIGTLSIGSRDPNTTFTQKQLNLLRAIADQTAGAIVKARLLQETERRAKQLATLNEITQQLTSTLEHEPLLQNILESAVQILDCEAGSLFMVDENTNELVFTVIVGPAASDLIGKRLPAGKGIVGKAVETRAPVVENNTRESKDWSKSTAKSTDEETGFSTQALLAVPLQVKERVIGVVEVINKKDGLPFVDDDENLLTAFAGQAAVAVENARLYTLTDQELNARVEELSIMQRIDRELNASLETDRAMRTTLEWAMRRSQADAGLLGMLDEEGVHIMAQEGYGNQLDNYKDKALPLELPAMLDASDSGQSQIHQLNPLQQGGLLPGTRTQVAVPLHREANVVGLILLECIEEVKIDLAFLSRLSDHAAISIANAQLYAEVEAANIAKSDFVSFVAHELKNPMTSIKGYTELIAAGAVGEINENQGNFLQTIRSNVIRMSTLVSDLNDNSKIEVGRLRMDFAPVEIAEIINNAVRSTDKQIAEKKQTISLEVPEDLPNIWADSTRVEQVLVNFVSNSYKYTQEEGEIIIGAEEADNKWDPEGAPKVVHIWIKDNGIGMTEEDQEKIFTKFFRSEDQKAREAPGTGLGLNITKSLIEMQGGRTWFESKFREGTTFHFTIPIAEK
ncbi:MAG: GAF domain-containing protein [Anaerolineae bacterium]|jgi:signal transduction histidine kinase/signal transduction protein with GAF and PtsI domain|nr:GAF domain-containing protein [Anaerolineae bacterium]MBT4309394.1 GAF domain-containing protein [Anaerolineae bacterium]MBT4459198.1 GAF domain-containing protein [Anaerolineae bacterium]MBT4840813.1 GAF domain-containing protein [Anaerolineae bacterium]MBT6061392.1 GAF domain-containing protein [Anaerolineae bacterium]